jgi:rfaE bifunctional protein kinase chain/domain
MDYKYLLESLKKISKVSVAVIGDFCLDAYWVIDDSCSEISLETGKRTRSVKKQRYSPGGAANVANNLSALKVKKVYALGVIGDDLFGRELKNILSKIDVNTAGLIVQDKKWNTPVFGKPYNKGEEESRIDFGNFNEIYRDTQKKLLKYLKDIIDSVEVIIINQQLLKSIYSDDFIEEINSFIAQYKNKHFIVDCRSCPEKFRNVYLKLNQKEAARINNIDIDNDDMVPLKKLKEYAENIYNINLKPVFITRGRRGMLVYDGKNYYENRAIQILRKIDPVGAGDTAISAIGAALAAGLKPRDAADIANMASAVTVQKLLVCGSASPEEILKIGAEPDYIYNPELAADIRRINYIEGTDIEIINRSFSPQNIRYAIFDHDGTISTLRQGWEGVMEPVMLKAILGDKYLSVNKNIYKKIKDEVLDYIDKSTGIETILQIEYLVEMVHSFGYVPKDKILDKFQYKKIYNKELMKLIDNRLLKFKQGKLAVNDFTIKGAFEFLEALYKKGVKLYLASGTDEDDVIHEASVLGYAPFFENRIYGALKDGGRCSKKMIVERILKENDLKGSSLICFGDGPVEIRKTISQGGSGVGLASDEVKKSGFNPDKRARLIEAGADIIISDFTQQEHLLSYFL